MTLLPTEKTESNGLSLLTAKTLLYGYPKVGKTTLAAEIDPDHTLFLATEPGQDAISVFRAPIRSWDEFLRAAAEIAKGDHPFKLIVIDTVDELARLCTEHVIGGMAETSGLVGFVHPSDLGYGKGYEAVAQEFRVKIAKLCNLGLGVMFISHVKEAEVKKPNGAEITKLGPDVGMKGMRKWLLGFVDLIAYGHILETTEGEQRVLRLTPTETVEAGGRVARDAPALPDLVPLTAEDFEKALESAKPSPAPKQEGASA